MGYHKNKVSKQRYRLSQTLLFGLKYKSNRFFTFKKKAGGSIFVLGRAFTQFLAV
ncbi:MAG: hypothetical protein RL115_1653 [Bacteroidota bacterium]